MQTPTFKPGDILQIRLRWADEVIAKTFPNADAVLKGQLRVKMTGWTQSRFDQLDHLTELGSLEAARALILRWL